MADASAGHPELLRRLRESIAASGPISFARFMDVALNDPEHGYYAAGAARLGRGGDFFTASDVGPAFGATIAHSLREMDAALGSPSPFRYVEHASGRGLLARDVLEALAATDAAFHARVSAELVDASAGMRASAAVAVPGARVAAPGEALAGGDGCVVAVELLDALPVHRVRRRGSRLVEVKVGLAGNDLVEVEAEPEPEVADWASRFGAAPEDGDEAETCLALGPALRSLVSGISRGFVLIVDYGHEAARLFGPAHRRGTLLAYHRHTVSEDLLLRVGEQDLTAHVNLTALAAEAEAIGLRRLQVTTQDRFLIANGILDRLGDDGDDSLAATKRRLQVKQLIHPQGMGRAFKVAVFSKGIEPPPELPGLRDPFARSAPRGGESGLGVDRGPTV